mgnify:CR=1 FL=1
MLRIKDILWWHSITVHALQPYKYSAQLLTNYDPEGFRIKFKTDQGPIICKLFTCLPCVAHESNQNHVFFAHFGSCIHLKKTASNAHFEKSRSKSIQNCVHFGVHCSASKWVLWTAFAGKMCQKPVPRNHQKSWFWDSSKNKNTKESAKKGANLQKTCRLGITGWELVN